MFNSNNKNNNSLSTPMVALYCLSILLICVILLFRSYTTHAAYAVGTSNGVKWSYADFQDSTGSTFNGTFELFNDRPTAFIRFEHNGMYQLCEYVEEEERAYLMSWVGNHTGSPAKGIYEARDKNGKITTRLEFPFVEPTDTPNQILSRFYSVTDLGHLTVTSNLYVFDSLESATAYYRDGDLSGIVSRPEPDYDYDHDFRQDAYDSDIPVPEISNPSFNGFHVDNADPSRDIEIYIETTFYGVKHVTNSDWPILYEPGSAEEKALLFVYNPDWKIATRRYNLINTDVSYSDADIDLLKMYKVDIVKDLTSDFKEWSDSYPTNSKLPDYSFIKGHGGGKYTAMYKLHNYYQTTGTTDALKLKNSGQASITYYVRFCQYVPGSGYTYGKWINYTYLPNGSLTKDDFIVGDTGVNPDTGEPTVTNPRPGKVDPDDGSVTFPDISDGGSLSDMVNNVLGTLSGISTLFGEFPGFLAETFGFIPNHIWSIIGAGLIFMIIVVALKVLLSLK